MKTILFLCTGNYYRSRFAEVFFNWHAKQRGLPWKAESRGLAIDPMNIGPMSHYTESRLTAHGIPFDDYQRLPIDVSRDDFSAAHHVVAVKEAEHRPLIQRRFPDCLTQVEFWKVHDIDCAQPDEALPHLEWNLTELLDRLPA